MEEGKTVAPMSLKNSASARNLALKMRRDNCPTPRNEAAFLGGAWQGVAVPISLDGTAENAPYPWNPRLRRVLHRDRRTPLSYNAAEHFTSAAIGLIDLFLLPSYWEILIWP